MKKFLNLCILYVIRVKNKIKYNFKEEEMIKKILFGVVCIFAFGGMAITAFADDTLPIYGSRIWFDLNGNGIQDQNEPSAPAIHFDILAFINKDLTRGYDYSGDQLNAGSTTTPINSATAVIEPKSAWVKQNLNKDWLEITDKAIETDDWMEYESVSQQFSDANPLMDNAEVPYRTGFGNLNLANWIYQNVPADSSYINYIYINPSQLPKWLTITESNKASIVNSSQFSADGFYYFDNKAPLQTVSGYYNLDGTFTESNDTQNPYVHSYAIANLGLIPHASIKLDMTTEQKISNPNKEITVTYTVKNDGTSDLENITLSDIDFPAFNLKSGEEKTFSVAQIPNQQGIINTTVQGDLNYYYDQVYLNPDTGETSTTPQKPMHLLTVTDDKQVTVTYPTTKQSTITVRYMDEEGNQLIDPITKTDIVGKEYSTEQKTFDGYQFEKLTGNASGVFTESDQEIVYVYKKIVTPPVKQSTITVRYMDEEGNQLIDPITKTDIVGKEYSTEQKTFDGYQFEKLTGNASGVFTENDQEIVYVYKKIDVLKEENKAQINKTSNTEFKEENKVNDSVKMDNSSTGKKIDKSLPRTGFNNNLVLNTLGSALLVVSFVGFTVVFVIKRLKQDK
ncbi:TPA: MucBP domain-containing protein [Enterococcus faecalis]|uniref:MucBP domain-containing protein n=5 Tax=Enterococcus faecalis TaxID=1351 RepID=UPI000D521A00|nr:MucBP domain-containing protein [Enterococcus faecalis]MCD4891229.1 MucBP domain-containing protein [Enterococcus faecalis]MCD4925196.1 MucBP domain-containing protein [Enterococcus faecalis]MCD4955787.1 MucBP domain-containing protein [Enterococcus faecalis]MCD4966436.1 MucBP domain-containing protein [Enterococcus faecalis]MCD5041209.1 MucBP domain-containing protein [Enterococcus faecalis]